MIKRIFSLSLALGVAFLILGLSIFGASAQTVNPRAVSVQKSSTAAADLMVEEATPTSVSLEKKKTTVDYYLPYPGILPDHPLYFLKMIRDRIWLILTTHPLKKAEVLLLFADKRIGAAQVLVEGNKVSLGLSTATKAEKYLERAIEQEKKAREAGQETRLFLEKLAKATSKHEEILLGLEEKVVSETELIEQVLLYSRRGFEGVQKRLEE